MKKLLYSNNTSECNLHCPADTGFGSWEQWKIWRLRGGAASNKFRLSLKGREWVILWPNREGERFNASAVFPVLERYEAPDGLTICYPSTASCRTLIFLDAKGGGIIVCASPDRLGRVTEFRVRGGKENFVKIEVLSCVGEWFYLSFRTWGQMEKAFSELQKSDHWQLLEERTTDSRWQVQVGLIGTDGETGVLAEEGFAVLGEIAALMKRKLGRNHILHVFGYARGHDIGYPDYTPSPVLGGPIALKKAIKRVHNEGQKAVFYLNGRIAAENSRISGKAALKDQNGHPVVETYNGRNFYVMDPSSEEWRQRLLEEAERLKSYGADGVQLDQLGGRAAMVSPGEEWGAGYIQLIKKIQSIGLTVWIQGLSDIYPADWFEMTYREENVLADGTIRGGTPLGEPDMSIFMLSVPRQVLLVPRSKLRHSSEYGDSPVIVDLEKGAGELFLYSPSYLTQLEKIINDAVFKSVSNAKSALRKAL